MKDNFKPADVNVFEGAQVITNTERILTNTKEDSLHFSNKGFLFSTNGSYHINTGQTSTNTFIVNAPQIQLGLDEGADTIKNPAVKGNELEEILNEVLKILDHMYNVDLLLLNPIVTVPGTPTAPDAGFKGKTIATRNRIAGLRDRLKEFKSSKVFIT